MTQTHYKKMGGYYPTGGGSEFAFNMIPIIEKAGGKVLVSGFYRVTSPKG